MMNLKTTVVKVLTVLLLVGVASAAVYITYNPEARLYFGIDKPGPDVEPVQTLVRIPSTGMWTNSLALEVDENDLITTEVAFKNHNPEPIIGTVVVTMTCDEGIFMRDDGTTFDFQSIEYRDPDMCIFQCNEPGRLEVISSDVVRFTPAGPREFPEETHVFGNLDIQMVGMAYGNYTCEIIVEAAT